MKNTLMDLNNHLFAELERLSDEDLAGEALDVEIKRASAVSKMGETIVDNARVVLAAQKFKKEYLRGGELPDMLEKKKTPVLGKSKETE